MRKVPAGLVEFLDEEIPDWRTVSTDPEEAAAFYGIEWPAFSPRETYEKELDFNEPDYRYLGDGYDDEDDG